MRNKTCVITGATSGIGKASAFELAAQGANLILLGRNEARGRAIVARIRKRGPDGKVEFLRCDLTIRSDVATAARAIQENCGTVDILINNAGARFNTFATNAEAVERTFAGNYLGHFFLTALLLEPLLNAASARIVILGSGAHAVEPPIDWNLSRGNYDRKRAYGVSKLAAVIWCYELARRLAGTHVTVNALDPGGVATRLGLNNGIFAWIKHLIYYSLHGRLFSSEHAGGRVVYLATSPELEGKSAGYYFEDLLIRSSAISYDQATAAQLWNLSVSWLGLNAESVGRSWKFLAP